MSHLIESQENFAYAWPARLVNSLGASMIENATENRRLFERLHFNLYLTRLEYSPYTRKFKARLFTSSIYGLLIVGRNGGFDLGKTLQSGTIVFIAGDRFSSLIGSGRGTGQVSSIGMAEQLTGSRFYKIFAEELAHVQQYNRKVVPNALFTRLDVKWKTKSSRYQKLSKYIYADLNGPVFFLSYLFENQTRCNFFEQEARNYSNRKFEFCD